METKVLLVFILCIGIWVLFYLYSPKAFVLLISAVGVVTLIYAIKYRFKEKDVDLFNN